MAKRDYYEVLGVERTADEAAIKAAYRKLAKKLHPDVNPGDKDAEEKFKEVNEAYQVLSDPKKRAQYDRFGHQQPGAGGAGGYGDFSGFGGFGGFDVEDIFSSFFGGGFGGGRARREQGPVPGADLRYDMTISFEEAARGCDKEINLVRDEPCENCHGTGAKPGTQPKTCPTCNGTGQVRTTSNTPFGTIQNVRTCPNCHGSGKTISDPCPKCNGRGKVRTSKRRTVRIPAGIDNGQIVTIRGQGEMGERGGEAGDLLIVVTVRPHRLFKRNGTDLYLEMPLTFTQAALGCETDVPTLEKPVKYRFPEGTQPGQTFRIRGQGVPSLRGGSRGDLYVTVTVEIPKRLSEKQKSILRQFDGTVTGQEYEQKKSFFDRVKEAFGGNS
ncbi:MAG TPA: molecular chaperone DnaJ [Candidatus Pullichristensenella avicola]|nr:molecular chaperone DnaJ [Candidatus Pullichristensenella avicola]